MKKWTLKAIRDLEKADKIKGFSADKQRKNMKYMENGEIKEGPLPRSKPAGLVWLDLNLTYWCNERSVTLQQEYRFDRERAWRFDYAIPAVMIAVEYEGGIFMQKSGHTSAAGVNRDIEKYTRAQLLGWKVVRVTASNYKTALQTLNQLYDRSQLPGS